MIITLCDEKTNICIDIKVNPMQKIVDTLAILCDGSALPIQQTIMEAQIISERQRDYVCIEESFEQAGIYNGDILHIV